jgi:hypothetical protein
LPSPARSRSCPPGSTSNCRCRSWRIWWSSSATAGDWGHEKHEEHKEHEG